MDADAPDVLRDGYTTSDNYRWICDPCFDDFRVKFEWSVEDEDA
jgi:hypothetical protein